MRNAFADEVTRLAADDRRLVVLSGDIGNKLFDAFKARHSDRFFNCGVAEANMTSVAAGMAACGLRPITYTITAFATVRCYEQIKLDVCYNALPVTIVGVGGGLSYASLGPTHHACEDVGALRLFPNMTVVCPADAWEVRAVIRAALRHEGPLFIRMGKKGEPVVHAGLPELVIGKALVVSPGRDACLLSTGTMLSEAVAAATLLAEQGVSTQVVSFHTIKPLDEAFLADVLGRFPVVVTVEEHSRVGGLGAAVAEWVADNGPFPARLRRVGTADRFLDEAGDQDHARRRLGISTQDIVSAVLPSRANSRGAPGAGTPGAR